MCFMNYTDDLGSLELSMPTFPISQLLCLTENPFPSPRIALERKFILQMILKPNPYILRHCSQSLTSFMELRERSERSVSPTYPPMLLLAISFNTELKYATKIQQNLCLRILLQLMLIPKHMFLPLN